MNTLRSLAFGAGGRNGLISQRILKDLNDGCMRQSKRFYLGETYEGTGKTTGYILNKKGLNFLCIDTISDKGFRLANGWFISGPAVFFPQALLGWNVKNINDVSLDSLALFTVLQPKPDLLLLGYGCGKDIAYTTIREMLLLLKELKINFEIMTTEDAATTFNFCCLDRRLVAAALIPPSKVDLKHGLTLLSSEENEKSLTSHY